MPYKVTWFFRDVNAHGWSESIYNTGFDTQGVYTRALALVDKRLDILGREAELIALRVANDDPQRDSALKSFAPGDGQGQYPPAADNNNTDFSDTSLLVLLYATSKKKGRLFLRGIPDDVCNNAGQYTPPPFFVNKFQTWAIALAGEGSWAVRTFAPPAAKVPITTIDQSQLTGTATIVTGAPNLLVPGDLVVFTGGRGSRGLRGRHRVLAAATDGITFRVPCNKLLLPYDGGMSVQKVAFELTPFSSATVVRITRRKAGRPFGVPPGRSKILI